MNAQFLPTVRDCAEPCEPYTFAHSAAVPVSVRADPSLEGQRTHTHWRGDACQSEDPLDRDRAPHGGQISEVAQGPCIVVTVGEGLKNPQGRIELPAQSVLDQPRARQLLHVLEQLPKDQIETWWSPLQWSAHDCEDRYGRPTRHRNDYRCQYGWRSAHALTIDVDYGDRSAAAKAQRHQVVPADVAKRLADFASTGSLPGNLWHATPKGARVVFALGTVLRDSGTYKRAYAGATELIWAALKDAGLLADGDRVGYWLDLACSDLARFMWAPCTTYKTRRQAPVLLLRDDAFDAHELAAIVPARESQRDAQQTAPVRGPCDPGDPNSDVRRAASRWNADHIEEWPTPGTGECPACGHRECFGRLPQNPTQWACFSANHEIDSGSTGRRGNSCWYGDAIDIAMRERGLSLIKLLQTDGYLVAPTERKRRSATTSALSTLLDVLDEREAAEERQAIMEEGSYAISD